MVKYKIAELELENCLKFEQNSIDYINMNDDVDYNIEQNEDEEYFQVLNKLDEIEKYSNVLNDERIKFKVIKVYFKILLFLFLFCVVKRNTQKKKGKSHKKKF